MPTVKPKPCKLCRAKHTGHYRYCRPCRARENEVRRAITEALKDPPRRPYSPRVVYFFGDSER